MSRSTLHEAWEFREPSMPAVFKVLDRVARVAIREETPEAATVKLRELLEGVRGHLPSWMTPEFWVVESKQFNTAPGQHLWAGKSSHAILPTSLSGLRVEFHPMSKDSVKASLPHRDLFVVGDSMLEALIGLGRLAGGSNGSS